MSLDNINKLLDDSNKKKENDFEETVRRRLAALETHIINLIAPLQSLDRIIGNPTEIKTLINLLKSPLAIDDRSLQGLIKELNVAMDNFRKCISELDVSQTFGEIRFIGKKMHEIEQKLDKFEKEGIQNKIRLHLELDGYEMVKKPSTFDKLDESLSTKKENLIKRFMTCIPERNARVVMLRLGLFDTNAQTYTKIGIGLGIGRERAGQIFRMGIRKLRHHSRESIVKEINNPKLNKEIYGKEECPEA